MVDVLRAVTESDRQTVFLLGGVNKSIHYCKALTLFRPPNLHLIFWRGYLQLAAS